MSTKLEFKGKDVDESINNACIRMHVSREELDIEILDTGSSGIFGLCKKQAVILVSKKEQPETVSQAAAEKEEKSAPRPKPKKQAVETKEKTADQPVTDVGMPADVTPKTVVTTDLPPDNEKKKLVKAEPMRSHEPEPPLPPEILADIKSNLTQILNLMHFPSAISAEAQGSTVLVQITGDHVEDIIANDGQALDSLQYLMRKIIGKKFPQKVILEIDAANFREKRRTQLHELARKLADEVKQTEKTRTISPLNPSERRIVHVALQEDKSIRSRSVGDGLFKKIIIYLPGKGRSRKRPLQRKETKN